MKWLCVLGLMLALAGPPVLGQSTPDDQFVRIYGLIQQADALASSNQAREAQAKYLEAQAALEKFEAAFPNWNEKIISYRKHYLAEKLAGPGVAARPAAAPAAAAETLEARAGRLEEELNKLRTERDALAARLREALSAQPAAARPSDLAKAQARIQELERENERLRGGGSAKPEPPGAAAAGTGSQARPPSQTAPGKAEDRSRLKEVEAERDELRRKVALLTRQVGDRPRGKGGPGPDQGFDQLAVLRARLEVYEARQAPYTPEELALLKAGAVPGGGAKAAARKPAREIPPGAAGLLEQANQDFEARRFEEAESKFQQALKLDEKNVGILTDLAAVQLERDRIDAAEATLKRALAEDPNDTRALSVLGIVRVKQKRYDEALDTLARAAQLDPENAVTQNYLGVALDYKGQRQPAETAFRRAVQLRPGYADPHFNLAVTYSTQKPAALELARWHYQKAIAAGHPRHPEIDAQLDRPAAGSSAK
jgi:Flp pilus assembly protein TadD